MFDDTSSYYVKGRYYADSGVRAAFWDDRLDIRYTVMSLIAVSQYQVALQRFQNEMSQ